MYNSYRLSWVFVHDLSAGCSLVKLSVACCLSVLPQTQTQYDPSVLFCLPLNKLCFSPHVSIILFPFSFTP